ncbi:hypothetical protein [Vibrio parahaemolyticus]|uniref:hypothetical protein n=1 Tax=Vibrio parahaemolyticus TaxID=670 RepID=UPI00111D4D37|nr:hypothetical protein [Vibrio parahaemolyticus]TOM79904.1 hypothetical protein CGH69_23470 [Vibrio parahaemolyticus]
MFKSLKSKAALVVASTVAVSSSAFAEVDPVISAGMVQVETAVKEIGAAGLPVLIAIGIFTIGAGIVVGLLRRGSRVV